jgi:acyl transferase domain-containing protein/acyl carrier protein
VTATPDQLASALRASVKEAELLRLRNEALLEASTEPIAIVGMSCRYPGGVGSPRDLWNLVDGAVDAVSGFPTDRGWDLERLYHPEPDNPGTCYVREGGFLADAADFDPTFFGILPLEALASDPQQRLLLEACWEALEDGGIVPASLRRSQTGVFAGAMYGDYGWGLSPTSGQIVSASASAASVISGRIAYTLGIEGPAITVDTACSSSLVTLHLASQALRQGDCSLALAGGATVMATPNAYLLVSAQRAFAPDGRCKSFADAADGVGWSEGVGMLVLERLSDAKRNGHPIQAVIRGSAVNQDGASNGLTAPHGPSQERVIRQALANAGLESKDVDAVEAHGTGTPLGDPIEAGALLATYGQDRESPLKLGSIKSNIGHTQAAAGVAGVIKMVMAMRERVLPKTLHLDRPSSKINWSAGEIELLDEAVEWSAAEGPRRAAVSSFGVSGTNAHLILEEAPGDAHTEDDPAPATPLLPGPVPLLLSAKSEPALRDQARRLASHLRDNPDLDPLDAGYSLATTRTAFEHRAAALGNDREQLLGALEALAGEGESGRLVGGVARGDRHPVFLFGGHGSQWQGMTLELFESSPVFAAHLRTCEEALSAHVDFSLLDVLRQEDGEWLERVDVVQPALFAVAVSLARLWQDFGVTPVAVAGHSQGEVAAAHIAGALSLEDAAHLAAVRGRLISSLSGQGTMISAALPAEQLESRIEPWGGRIEIAAFNGPASTILSGNEEAIGQLLEQLAGEGARARRILGAAAASHSAQVEVLRDEILETFASLSPRSGDIPFHSTVIGGPLDTAQLDAEYWYRNLRQPVRLEQVVRGLLEDGHRLLVEPSSHPVLGLAVGETIEDALGEPGDAVFLGTLRRDEGGPERFALSLAAAHVAGAEVEWPKFFSGSGAGRVSLPTYAFQRRRFWLEASSSGGDLHGSGLDSAEHPLLGATMPLAEGDGVLLTGRLSLATHPWLGDHVYEVALLPGTGFVELALRAGAEVGCETLEELTLQAPLILPEEGAVAIQVSVSEPDDEDRRELAVHSRADGEGQEWVCHAMGLLSSSPLPPPEVPDAWPPEGAEPLEVEGVYDRLAEHGLLYGPAFQCVDSAWLRGEELFVEASLPDEVAGDAQRFGLHPALLDASAHVGFDLAVSAAERGGESGLALPFAWRGVRYYASGVSSMRLRVAPVDGGYTIVTFDDDGAPIAAVESVVARPAEPGRLREVAGRTSLYAVEWLAADSDPDSNEQRLAILGAEEIDGVEAERYQSLPALLEALEGGADVPDTVVVASRAGEGDLLEETHQGTRRAQALVRAWAALEPLCDSRLVFLTEGAAAVGEEELPSLAIAPILGLIRSAQSEHPGRFGTIDSDWSKGSMAALASALAHPEEPEIALREGKLLVPRLTRAQAESPEPSDGAIDPDATVLITGGLSGIGAQVARHLAAEHGARQLLLVSRSGEQADGALELKAELEGLGAVVSIAACDVSDRKQLSRVFDSIPSEHPLGTVVHSAAVLEDGVLESQDADRLERVMRPKVDAAWHLHELTEQLELSQFILFSSAAGVLGGAGQTNYSAANAFLDALAHLRCAKGLPGSALAWGLWAQESKLADGNLSREGLETIGRQITQRFAVMPMFPDQGLQLFDSARALSLPLVLPVQFDPEVMRAQARDGTLPTLLRNLVRLPKRRQREVGSLAARLASVPEAERQGFCRDLVRSHAAAVLGHTSPAEIEPDRAFREMGFDSLGAVELRNRLSAAVGMRLPATLVFDYPSANALGDFLLSATKVDRPGKPVPLAARSSSLEEPIAIVGMSCRYPGGVSSPQGLWALADAGVDAIAGFPTNRGWDLERLYDPDPDNPDTCYVREGGFLLDAGDFDPAFFGISAFEAEMMDPQERLLLEACWEALEDAVVDPVSLRGSETGVFAGVMYQDYGPLPGMSSSSVSGRVAYSFGLEGPAISVDTACSSSLVAMHLASQALRQGECGLALAGGVAIASSPAMLRLFSRQRALSPDGRCKSFAEGADGTGFSEGVGVLVLERLSEAERNSHQVLATIKGSAVNQDGASNGLTAPNGPSQERVIRQALANAGLEAKDIDAVEAHGTGTALGDPIEAGALLATYGQEREVPLKLGSIKSNLGHPQAAAGVAGVIKMVMAMREGVLPKTLHVDAPSSKIQWDAGEVELLTEAEAWLPNGHPRRAGVSSFGASGTNAHLILEEPLARSGDGEGEEEPAPAEAGQEVEASGQDSGGRGLLPGSIPLALSAKSEPALREAAARLAAHLEGNPDLDPIDVAYSLATAHTAFAHRAVVLGDEREQLLERLGALASGSEAPGLARGRARESRPVFLFGGQGSQWPRMGQELLGASAVFASHIQACEQALSPHVDWSLSEVLRDEEGSWLDRLDIVQPALFAVMVSLARLWEELGVAPGAVVGHSQGEVAAAHIAGGLSLEDAALVIAMRAKAMTKIAGKGAMLSVSLSAAQLRERLVPFGERLSLAAINGPASMVVSGEPEALAGLRDQCEQDGIRTKPVAVDYAAHSAQIEDLREELLEAFAPISPQSGTVRFHSTLSGELLDTKELDPEYWYRNLRQTVLLEPVLRSLLEAGERTFLELSPHPVLGFGLQETIEDTLKDQGATVLTSLRREEGGPERFALSVAQAYAAGTEVDWEAFFKGVDAKRVSLPTYPFQRRRYWIDSPLGGSDPVAIGQAAADHPLLGAELSLAGGEQRLFTGRLSLQAQPWLADHRVHDVAILPTSAFVELALRAGEQLGCELVEELDLRAPLILPERGALALQVCVAGPGERGRRAIAVHSRPDAGEEQEWTLHAEGVLAPRASQPDPELSEGGWPPEGAEPLDVEFAYERIAETGASFGSAFQGLTGAWRRGEEVYAEVSLPDEQARVAEGFGIHPALLDAALHAGMLDAVGSMPRLPSSWARVSLHGSSSALRVRLAPTEREEEYSLTAVDETGALVLTVDAVRREPLEPGALRAAAPPRALHRVEWESVPLEAKSDRPGAGLAILGDFGLPGLDGVERFAGLAELLEAIEAGAAPEVVLAQPWQEGAKLDLPEASRAAVTSTLALLQTWVGDERLEDVRLTVLTQRAVAAGDAEDPDLALAPVCGLVRSAHSEHPDRFALIDLDGSAASTQVLATGSLPLGDEPHLALREGAALAPRLVRAKASDESSGASPIDPDSTVLITGGTGALGALVARHLAAEHGARHLLLASRSGEEADGAGELQAELEALGCEARLEACDVADREQLAELLGSISSAHPLGAVIHAARVLDDGVLEALDGERVERVMRPKSDAAWYLHELTKDLDLSQFLLFSSVSAICGNPAQANYAAASSFLDALAAHRRAEGLSGASLAWSNWASGDGGGDPGLAPLARLGFTPLSSEQVLELFDSARASGESQPSLVELDRSRLRSQAEAGALQPILRGLAGGAVRRRRGSASLARRLAGMPRDERKATMLELVRSHAATALGHGSAQDVEPTRAFQELGFDSLGAVELRNSLSVATGLRLPPTLVFDYPSATTLAEFLRRELEGEDAGTVVVGGPVVSSDEPIAIVGMACRYPGADSPAELWELVASETDAISGLPTDRGWDLERLFRSNPDDPGTTPVREGGFIDRIADFDCGFFGISPRDALAIDPQQKLFLEATWEALESAGIDPGSLRGSPTGVFAGAGFGDYAQLLASSSAASAGSVIVGASSGVIAGRTSYSFGFEGPTMSVDTACSSSLVAMHLAMQALRGGECSLALAGGVMVMSTAGTLTDLSGTGGLAPDGRCKAFSDSADGAGASEGVGTLLLERLSDAERNGHPVQALVRASAVNQDGASYGLTAPNGPSQERVMRTALASAGLEPRDIDAVEAHGTGTPLGDPIEAGALFATYGQDRDAPLKLGSIKSNIGHAAAAAGIAGVIKMVMAMREGVLPKTLHADRPSANIDWDAGAVELLTEPLPWARNGRPRRAAVSAFGVSGTNAHLILEEPPQPAVTTPTDCGVPGEGDRPPLPGPIPLLLSAKSEEALQGAARRLADHLQASPDLDPVDVAYSLATTRGGLTQRAVALGGDREQLLSSLAGVAHGTGGPRSAQGKVLADQRPVFLFPGFGSQWAGMGLELLESSPVFARRMRECDEALEPYLEWSVEDVLRGTARAQELSGPEVGSVVLFATTVSLAGLWRACGVEPRAVAGHSQGELIAAHVAGGLSLDDAARVAVMRIRALLKLVGHGAMASVALSAEQLEARLESWGGRVGIAAMNGPSTTVVSGDPEPLDELIEQCLAEGVRAKKIPGALAASHSAQVETLREEMLESLAPISPCSGEIPFHSTVTGELLDTGELDAEYWYRNARETVRLDPVVRKLIAGGSRLLLEVSPHPVLRVGLEETAELAVGQGSVAVLGTLQREEGGAEKFALSLAEAHAAGAKIDWRAFFAGTAAKRVELPTYSFERKRYWASPSTVASDPTAIGQAPAEHPLLGATIESTDGESLMLTGRVSRATHPWLADYAVEGNVLLAGAVFVEVALKAGGEVGADRLDELSLEEPLVVPESEAVQLRVSVGPADEQGRREVAVHSRPEGAPDEGKRQAWSRNAAGVLSGQPAPPVPRPEGDEAAWPPQGAEPLDVDLLYERLFEAGLDCGPSFRVVRAAWALGEEIFAEVSLADEQRQDAARFGLHPVLLDAAAHASIDYGSSQGEVEAQEAVALPFVWRGVHLSATGTSALRVRMCGNGKDASLMALDEAGAVVLSIDSVGSRPLDAGRLRAARRRRSLYRVEWSAPSARPSAEDLVTAILGESEAPGLKAERYADLDALLAAIEAGAAVPELVLTSVPASLAQGDLPAAAHAAARYALETAQAWLAAEPVAAARLVFLTARATVARAGEDPELATAPLWGLIHTAHSESLDRFRLIDVDGTETSWGALPAALATAGEPQVAIRDGALLAPRLTRVAPAESESAVRPIDPESTVLISGGTSGVGAAVARHLVAQHGVQHLLLVSRRGAAVEGVADLEAELTELGAVATVAACDVTDREQVEGLIASIPPEHPLGAVVHSAAALDNGMLTSLDSERLSRVMGPKVDGAWHLHELTKHLDLSQFLLFSSAAGLIGNATQASYAAANVFLDALAARRQSRGLPGTSMAWGAWALGTGMSVDDLSDADRSRLERSGLVPMSGEEGLELFDLARASDRPLLVPMGLNSAALGAQSKAGVLPALLRGLVRGPASREDGVGPSVVHLASLPNDEREGAALDLVLAQVAPVLGFASAAEVEPDRNLQEMGLDSLGVVELRNRLAATTGLPVPVLALADNPTPAGIAGYLLSAAIEGDQGSNGRGGGATSPGAATETAFVSLLGEARERGTVGDFIELLSSASRFRPAFGTGSPAPHLPKAIRLAEGEESPSLVLIPSVGPMSGPQEYVKLAREFEDRTVFTLSLPGFSAGQALPADIDALTEMLAAAISDSDIGSDFALAGHSSGGWIAHALATHLEGVGVSPAAVVLLDTYDPQDDRLNQLIPMVLAGVQQAAEDGSGLDDTRLTATGGYQRIFAEWRPAKLATETLFVQAGDSKLSGSDNPEEWYGPIVTVPGSHFSMLNEQAADTASAIQRFFAVKEQNTHESS